MAITKINTPELLDINTTGAKQLPSGPTTGTGGRPTTGLTAGDFRYNTTLKYVEYYDGTSWFQIDTDAQVGPFTPSGNFNTNTYFGNGATQAIDAKFNEAANFNGSSSFVTLPDSSSISQQNNFTISFWVKPNGFVAYGTVVTFYSNYRNYVDIRTGGVLGFQTTSGNQLDTPSGSITDGVWQHIAVTKSSTAGTVIYVDGVSVATDSSDTGNASDFTSASYPNTLGAFKTTGSVDYFFPGSIDQVRIYNSALDQAAVTALQLETTTTASSLSFPSGETAIATYQLDGNGDDISTNYNGTTTDIGYTGLKFTPDFVWIKQRSSPVRNNLLFDTVRGPATNLNILYSDLPNAQDTSVGNGFLSSISTNALNLGSSVYVNGSGEDYVAWCWKAGGAPTATNSAGAGNVPTADSVKIDGVSSTTALDGTLPAISISANTAAGFSIVTNKTSDSEHTVAHGLNAAPELILSKPVSNGVYQWNCWANGFSEYQGIELSTSNQRYTNGGFRTVYSTSTTTMGFGLQFLSATNYGANTDIVNYCFHSVSGYQKIGTYLGDGNASGPIETTGFQPRFLMIKAVDRGGNWVIMDSARDTSNPRYHYLEPNTNTQEQGSNAQDWPRVDFNTNGFQLKGTDGIVNEIGKTYLYLAIA